MANPTLERVIEKFLDTEIGKKLTGTVKKEDAASRKVHATARKDLIARREQEAADRTEVVNAAQTDRDAALTAYQDAETAFRRVYGERFSWSHSMNQQIAEHERALRQTADPSVAEFIEECRARQLQYREERPTVNHEDIYRQDLPVSVPFETDGPSHEARTAYVGEVLAKAERLQLEVVPDVAAKLQKLRAGIPRLTMTPITYDDEYLQRVVDAALKDREREREEAGAVVAEEQRAGSFVQQWRDPDYASKGSS